MKLVDGYTLMHEHVHIDLSRIKDDLDTCLDCKEETIKEFKRLYELGVRNILEVTNVGMGRDVAYIDEVAQASGINIIKSTGCYKDPFILENEVSMTTEQLAEFMIKEIQEGFSEGHGKAEAIGEIGTSKNEWTVNERKLFDAAILAHKVTNKPIYTHTTLSTLALEQANYFVGKNADVSKIIIGHVDLNSDIEYILSVLKTGVNVGFDTIGKNNYLPDDIRIEHLLKIEKEGYLGQVVLSEDLTRKSHLLYKGGIGYAYLFENFLPRLKEKGMSQENIDKMLIENPKRILES